MKSNNLKIICAVVLIALSAAGFFKLINFAQSPEVREISQIKSSGGNSIATIRMAVYGDHWFVNEARLEVLVSYADANGQRLIVYSSDAHSPEALVIKWLDTSILLIEDDAEYLKSARIQSYPNFQIKYRPKEAR